MNNLSQRLLGFSSGVLKYCKNLGPGMEMQLVRLQLGKAASSAGANYMESQSASSRADFINKIHIALKELKEAEYWLNLGADLHPDNGQLNATCQQHLKECGELIKILTSCILTAKGVRKQ
jgi:four helix bundle protein